MNEVNLYVPGRVSIIGELSDLVVDYISQNNKIIPGEVVAGGIDKGIYASITKSKDFRFEYNKQYFKAQDMDTNILEKEAKSGKFFSYVASCALLMKRKYNVSGINAKVRYMSLPLQKGLSSSAAVCVLVVKAFNLLYNLNLDYHDIMELAYQAERNALSMCGRLDQICAKGLCLSHIIFHENSLEVFPIEIKEELNFVITDLNGHKDTKKILSTIHECFPMPQNIQEELVRKTLCEDNKHLVREAIEAIRTGNKQYLGKMLLQIQKNLDQSIGKICPEFEGPLLHQIMSDDFIKAHSYGSKGTGSNSDGSIIILAKDKQSQNDIIKYLKNEFNMNSFEYNIRKTYSVKKSIIDTSNNEFDEKELLQLLEVLDTYEINEIILAGNKKTINYVENNLNKKYTDEQFEKLSIKEKEHQIKLYRIYEKISFIELKELNKEYIAKKLNNEKILYINKYSKNEITNILNNSNNNAVTLNNISEINKLNNTIIK